MLTAILTMILSATVNPSFDNKGLLPKIAVENCKHLRKASPERKKKALEVANIMYQVEKEMGIPDVMRGMSLSAGCLESGFNPNAKGDRKFSKNKKTPRAIGVLQMWRFYEKAYGTNRYSPRSSALGWLKHIKRMVPQVKRQCRYRTTRKIWVAAWVTGIRYRKPGGRCKERPLHYRYFRKMRKIYESKTSKSLIKSGKTL